MPEFIEELPHIPQIIYAAGEIVDHEDYHWDNRNRSPENTLVIQRTLSGEAILTERNRDHRVGSDTAMLFVYGEQSRYRIGDPSLGPYRHEYVVIRPVGGIPELLQQIREDFGSIVRMEGDGEGARLLGDLVLMFHEEKAFDQLEMASLAYRLMLAIYREQLASSLGSDPVSYLRYVLQTQFRSLKNLKEWMADMPLSREHLTRLFTERYGEGPATFLRHLRLNHARLLARTTVMPVEDLAIASGFSSTQTLRRAYRRQFGTTVGIDRPRGVRLAVQNPRKS